MKDYAILTQVTDFELLPADAILNSNLGLPLKGVAIGNGWIDSQTQYPSYLEYALKHGIVAEGGGVSGSLFDIDLG